MELTSGRHFIFDTNTKGDQIKRKATTIGEHIQEGIPGAREMLPVKP
jgi:hypothetical protein